mmetsp:Transcript_63735/g.137071  ORF Transcript_63735/g.137071 Transcript_63735/m.137071 type:complete len:279 (+) Transcript_63735:1965-2801(+)
MRSAVMAHFSPKASSGVASASGASAYMPAAFKKEPQSQERFARRLARPNLTGSPMETCTRASLDSAARLEAAASSATSSLAVMPSPSRDDRTFWTWSRLCRRPSRSSAARRPNSSTTAASSPPSKPLTTTSVYLPKRCTFCLRSTWQPGLEEPIVLQCLSIQDRGSTCSWTLPAPLHEQLPSGTAEGDSFRASVSRPNQSRNAATSAAIAASPLAPEGLPSTTALTWMKLAASCIPLAIFRLFKAPKRAGTAAPQAVSSTSTLSGWSMRSAPRPTRLR